MQGLSKSFDGKQVVRNLSLRVRRGQIYGFLGPNGSGKTTTLRMICGLLTPDGGRGTCLGYDILTEREKIKRRVGYMTQRFSLYQDLSIKENLEFVARVYDLADPGEAARAGDRKTGASRPREATGRHAVRRLEAAPRARRLHPAESRSTAARRAHRRRRSEGAARVLGRDPQARRGRHDGARVDPLHGRGRALPRDRLHRLRRALGAGHHPRGASRPRGLRTYTVSGPDLNHLAEKLVGMPGVDMVAPFGTNLHVAGRDAAALDATVAKVRGD